MPTVSANGANKSCDTAKPHSAAPPIHPTSSFVSTNSRFSESMIAPTVANATDVAIKATQLPIKSLEESTLAPDSVFMFSDILIRCG